MTQKYHPPHAIIPAIVNLVAQVSEAIGSLKALSDPAKELRLRRINRIRTIQGSLAIEGNTLSQEQITAILEGKADSAPFITFMLRMILDAVSAIAPQVAPQVRRLLEVIQDEMTREELQSALNLQDRKSFRERYLKPALEQGRIEMTIPGKPNSRLQKYRLTERDSRHYVGDAQDSPGDND